MEEIDRSLNTIRASLDTFLLVRRNNNCIRYARVLLGHAFRTYIDDNRTENRIREYINTCAWKRFISNFELAKTRFELSGDELLYLEELIYTINMSVNIPQPFACNTVYVGDLHGELDYILVLFDHVHSTIEFSVIYSLGYYICDNSVVTVEALSEFCDRVERIVPVYVEDLQMQGLELIEILDDVLMMSLFVETARMICL